jgi:ABC-type transport system involved in multi-copper enzyme maturation permease subunit
MKTIIWKELRENLKWAVLALLCLTLAENATLYQHRDTIDAFNGVTLCSSAFLLVSAFGCSLVGAVLGALQILPELRRDQWAALLHRPAPRSTIFFGKVVAGLLLYLLATALPLLASIAYAAAPGQFPAPLVPGMILPAASDVCLGMVFYFSSSWSH